MADHQVFFQRLDLFLQAGDVSLQVLDARVFLAHLSTVSITAALLLLQIRLEFLLSGVAELVRSLQLRITRHS